MIPMAADRFQTDGQGVAMGGSDKNGDRELVSLMTLRIALMAVMPSDFVVSMWITVVAISPNRHHHR